MRLLLISDTHGTLGLIDELAGRVRAEAVIHAGDFGFFDDESPVRLSDRELRLQVTHSDLPNTEKTRMGRLPRDQLIEQVRNHRLLGEFQSYLEGRKTFHVPVYAVWGNHEDKDVIQRLCSRDIAIANLHILHHRQGYWLGPAFVYGLGGNLLPGSKMMQNPVAGGGGKIWNTLSQYCDLVETAGVGPAGMHDAATGLRIFVSHLSPGKEPFIELIGARTRADFTVSGHMGAPNTMVWNPFTVRSLEEAERRLRDGLETVKRACLGAAANAQGVEEAFAVIGRIPEDSVDIGRGIQAPRWFRRMTHINLPDADAAYAVMDIGENGCKLQAFIR